MFDATGGLPPLLTDLGLWVGLGMTLALFSLLLGDNLVARWAQHILVGAAMGYLAVVAVQGVLRPRLIEPLLRGEWQTNVAPLVLGVMLLAAALERIVRQSRLPEAGPSRGSGRVWGIVGVLPLALLLGTGLTLGLVGIVQGTLWPQTGVVLLNTWEGGRIGPAFWYGGLTLLLTTATLLHLTLDRSRHVDPLPRPFRDMMRGWVWIGQRALWIAAGLLLARLFASRFTMLFDRLDATGQALQQTGLVQWFVSLWTTFAG
ncbi:MAG: hypothetical protein ACRC1H_18025 [Caldilineaceae bacterium]